MDEIYCLVPDETSALRSKLHSAVGQLSDPAVVAYFAANDDDQVAKLEAVARATGAAGRHQHSSSSSGEGLLRPRTLAKLRKAAEAGHNVDSLVLELCTRLLSRRRRKEDDTEADEEDAFALAGAVLADAGVAPSSSRKRTPAAEAEPAAAASSSSNRRRHHHRSSATGTSGSALSSSSPAAVSEGGSGRRQRGGGPKSRVVAELAETASDSSSTPLSSSTPSVASHHRRHHRSSATSSSTAAAPAAAVPPPRSPSPSAAAAADSSKRSSATVSTDQESIASAVSSSRGSAASVRTRRRSSSAASAAEVALALESLEGGGGGGGVKRTNTSSPKGRMRLSLPHRVVQRCEAELPLFEGTVAELISQLTTTVELIDNSAATAGIAASPAWQLRQINVRSGQVTLLQENQMIPASSLASNPHLLLELVNSNARYETVMREHQGDKDMRTAWTVHIASDLDVQSLLDRLAVLFYVSASGSAASPPAGSLQLLLCELQRSSSHQPKKRVLRASEFVRLALDRAEHKSRLMLRVSQQPQQPQQSESSASASAAAPVRPVPTRSKVPRRSESLSDLLEGRQKNASQTEQLTRTYSPPVNSLLGETVAEELVDATGAVDIASAMKSPRVEKESVLEQIAALREQLAEPAVGKAGFLKKSQDKKKLDALEAQLAAM